MERLERIKNKWMPDDGFGIGHPIHTDELEEDVRYLVKSIEELRNEIVDLRGKAHLSCPKCHEDCIGWVTDGIPCSEDWQL